MYFFFCSPHSNRVPLHPLTIHCFYSCLGCVTPLGLESLPENSPQKLCALRIVPLHRIQHCILIIVVCPSSPLFPLHVTWSNKQFSPAESPGLILMTGPWRKTYALLSLVTSIRRSGMKCIVFEIWNVYSLLAMGISILNGSEINGGRICAPGTSNKGKCRKLFPSALVVCNIGRVVTA